MSLNTTATRLVAEILACRVNDELVWEVGENANSDAYYEALDDVVEETIAQVAASMEKVWRITNPDKEPIRFKLPYDLPGGVRTMEQFIKCVK